MYMDEEVQAYDLEEVVDAWDTNKASMRGRKEYHINLQII
jgi:hypothetical protein